MKISTFRPAAIAVLCLGVANLGFVSNVQAAIVGTDALVTSSRDANLATVRAQLNRAEVKQQLQTMGVDTVSVEQRVAALSDSELQRMADEMSNAPAGGEILAIVGITFVILLILEFVGVIDIFKRIP